eukprot:EC096508.1.p1 GENE.EC096508.1~~EC096508.1.p1  ORF type:complete len:123 (-),score=1.48 EC096508.1:144-512(-)
MLKNARFVKNLGNIKYSRKLDLNCQVLSILPKFLWYIIDIFQFSLKLYIFQGKQSNEIQFSSTQKFSKMQAFFSIPFSIHFLAFICQLKALSNYDKIHLYFRFPIRFQKTPYIQELRQATIS